MASSESNLLITVDVYGAMKFSKTFDAHVVFEPSMHILSLTDIGIPKHLPTFWFDFILSSISFAFFSARSFTRKNA